MQNTSSFKVQYVSICALTFSVNCLSMIMKVDKFEITGCRETRISSK